MHGRSLIPFRITEIIYYF